MQTHKITLSYPDSWLTVNITINNRDTNATLETWVATENGTTATYDYDFSGADNVDYIYIASVSGYNDIKGAVFYEAASGGWGWASVADIWSAQIGDYSGSAGSFANKFEQYGWVSHVIDRSSLDDDSKKQLVWFKDKMEEFAKTLKDFKSNEKDFNNIVDAIKNQPNKTTIVNKGWQYEETIWELIVEWIPQIIDKLDEATQIIPIYEELLEYMEQREKDWEQLVQDLIDNN